VSAWLEERRLTVDSEDLTLKGFDEAQHSYRLRASIPM
jgi:hypothetical protein